LKAAKASSIALAVCCFSCSCAAWLRSLGDCSRSGEGRA